MMTAIVQCPNTACGRVSHLGDDPLGRIFRCPHCLTKLPTASASAADSGWTAIVGPPRLGARTIRFQIDSSSALGSKPDPARSDDCWPSLEVSGSGEWRGIGRRV